MHKESSKKVIAHLSDHDQLVETFQEIRQLFPLLMQVQRRRKRDSEIHESSIDTSMNMRGHIVVGPEVKSSHDIDTPLTSIDQSFGGHSH